MLCLYIVCQPLLPKSVSEDTDKLVRNFWWKGKVKATKYWCPVSWSSVCQPKSCGGLGLRRFHVVNRALVAKLGWYLQTEPRKFGFMFLRLSTLRSQIFCIVLLQEVVLGVGKGSLRLWTRLWFIYKHMGRSMDSLVLQVQTGGKDRRGKKYEFDSGRFVGQEY